MRSKGPVSETSGRPDPATTKGSVGEAGRGEGNTVIRVSRMAVLSIAREFIIDNTYGDNAHDARARDISGRSTVIVSGFAPVPDSKLNSFAFKTVGRARR